jgi:hypothetical protein
VQETEKAVQDKKWAVQEREKAVQETKQAVEFRSCKRAGSVEGQSDCPCFAEYCPF